MEKCIVKLNLKTLNSAIVGLHLDLVLYNFHTIFTSTFHVNTFLTIISIVFIYFLYSTLILISLFAQVVINLYTYVLKALLM